MSFDLSHMTDPIIPAQDADNLRRKLYEAYDRYFTDRITAQETERERRWNRDYSSPEAYLKSVEPNRRRLMQMLGAWDAERQDWLWHRGPLMPRVEPLFETPDYKCERVFITVFDEVEVDCLILTPHGEGPRPAILCQHGLAGGPELACGFCTERESSLYNAFGIRMAKEGFVVFAPRMLGGYGRGQYAELYVPPHDHDPARAAIYMARTRIHRKAMQSGLTLFGAEMFALSRFVDYVQTLATVIPDRIGLYGLSQGGQTALIFPACDQRITASVCSAYFNWRMMKQMVSDSQGHYTAYIDTNEEDKLFTGHLLEFSDSDIASLIAPRAFMVECGKQDAAVWWEHAVKEYEKLKGHYERLGIGAKTELCLHEGGHECCCEDTFAFLKRWV